MSGRTIATYVLEASAKINGRGQISHPTAPKTVDQFAYRFNHCVHLGSWSAKFG